MRYIVKIKYPDSIHLYIYIISIKSKILLIEKRKEEHTGEEGPFANIGGSKDKDSGSILNLNLKRILFFFPHLHSPVCVCGGTVNLRNENEMIS